MSKSYSTQIRSFCFSPLNPLSGALSLVSLDSNDVEVVVLEDLLDRVIRRLHPSLTRSSLLRGCFIITFRLISV